MFALFNTAIPDKPVPFLSIQGTHGLGHTTFSGEKYADTIIKLQEGMGRKGI